MSGLRDFLGFFKRTKSKGISNKDGTIIDKNKKVERWKEEYPITTADYTQYRWRAVTKGKKHKNKKLSKSDTPHIPSQTGLHKCENGCSCKLVKEYTKAKERGDLLTIQQIRDGTFDPEKNSKTQDKIGESSLHPEYIKSVVSLTNNLDKTVECSDCHHGNKSKSILSGNHENFVSIEHNSNISETDNANNIASEQSVDEQSDTPNIHENIPYYYEENENVINQMAQKRQDAKREKSLRRSFRRTVSRLQKNTREISKKRRNYNSLDCEHDSDVEPHHSNITERVSALSID